MSLLGSVWLVVVTVVLCGWQLCHCVVVSMWLLAVSLCSVWLGVLPQSCSVRVACCGVTVLFCAWLFCHCDVMSLWLVVVSLCSSVRVAGCCVTVLFCPCGWLLYHCVFLSV